MVLAFVSILQTLVDIRSFLHKLLACLEYRNKHQLGTEYYFLADGYKISLGSNPKIITGFISFVVVNYTSKLSRLLRAIVVA